MKTPNRIQISVIEKLTENEKNHLVVIKNDLEEMVRNRRFNPMKIEDLTIQLSEFVQKRAVLSTPHVAKLCMCLELMRESREQVSWELSLEKAFALIVEILKEE